MQKALTGILLLFMTGLLHAQSWTPASPNIYFTGGKVGIGTSSPQTPLHVSGSGSGGVESLIEATDNGWAMLELKSNGKTWQWAKRPSGEGDALKLFYLDPGTSSLWQGPFLTAIPSTGNFGIGLANSVAPAYRLDVYTPNTNDGVKVTTSSGRVMLHGNNMSSGAYNGITQVGDAGLIFGNSGSTPNFGFVIAPWSGILGGLRIDNNGSVGIGTFHTTDANYKLFVEAGIRTRKITVDQTAWPDYVFHPGYALPPLSSVATYIRDNGHLADVPSADSVAKNGVDLGSNQAVLLKKIEELTLYVIVQDKALKEQAQRLDELDRLVKAQQKVLDALNKKLR